MAALTTNFLLYYLKGERLDHWDADVFFLAFLAGVGGLVIFSLLTPPEPRLKTDSFYGRLQHSADGVQPAGSETSVPALRGLDAPELSSPQPTLQAARLGQQSLLANARLLETINGIHQQSRRTYGAPRITAELREEGLVLGTWWPD